MTRKLVRTTNVYPPIPSRRFDWCAYIDGHEENPSLYGWGATQLDALKELGAILEDYEGPLSVLWTEILEEIEGHILKLLPEGQP